MNPSNQNKKTMRIAMVGVGPADQVTFKGYLRVLLRLDVDLEWVVATHHQIDLLVINNEFRQASSILRLLQAHPHTVALYVSRSTASDGQLSGDLLELPLKQINVLYDWLVKHVPLIKSTAPAGYQPSANSATTTSSTTTSTTINRTTSTQTQVQTQTNSSARSSTPANNQPVIDERFNDVVELITTLHKRPKTFYELLQDGTTIAIIDSGRRLLWAKPNALINPSHAWRLRVFTGGNLDAKQAVDMSQWLWDKLWDNPGDLINLSNTNHLRYQLRTWIKPDESAKRREVLKILTSMEKEPITAAQIASRANVSLPMVNKALVALLIADCLQDANYRDIKVYNLTRKPSTQAPQSQSVTSATPSTPKPSEAPVVEVSLDDEPPVKKTEPEQQEKMGFLARLRRKLGL